MIAPCIWDLNNSHIMNHFKKQITLNIIKHLKHKKLNKTLIKGLRKFELKLKRKTSSFKGIMTDYLTGRNL